MENKTVYILTYNTADKPERRIIAGVYATKEAAGSAFKKIKENIGESFIVDYELDEETVIG